MCVFMYVICYLSWGIVEAVLTRGSKKWQALASYLHVAAVHGALGQLLHLCSTHQHYRAVVATIYALHCARVSSSFFLGLLFWCPSFQDSLKTLSSLLHTCMHVTFLYFYPRLAVEKKRLDWYVDWSQWWRLRRPISYIKYGRNGGWYGVFSKWFWHFRGRSAHC